MSCVLKLCQNSYRKNKCEINKKTFFSINKIKENEILYDKWIKFIGYTPTAKKPLICSDHFEPKYFQIKNGSKCLTDFAVPSLNGFFLGKYF